MCAASERSVNRSNAPLNVDEEEEEVELIEISDQRHKKANVRKVAEVGQRQDTDEPSRLPPTSASSPPPLTHHRDLLLNMAFQCREAECMSENTQLVALSVGMNGVGVAASFFAIAWREAAAASGTSFSIASSLRILCLVLPDGTAPEKMAAVASDMQSELKRCFQLLRQPFPVELRTESVRVLQEGSSVKERCTAYSRGGLLIATARVLVADLLHQRLYAPFLTATVILWLHQSGQQQGGAGSWSSSTTSNTSFFLDLLRDGRRQWPPTVIASTSSTDSGGTATTVTTAAEEGGVSLSPSSVAPTVVLCSNSPVQLQRLLQRHQRGHPRFTHQAHIGSIQLFPRFKTDVMTYYEGLAKQRPLAIDRVMVSLSPSTVVLDHLLGEIITEVWQELQQHEDDGTANASLTSYHPSAYRRAAAVAMDEDTSVKHLPRSAPLAAGSASSTASGGAFAYVRKPWRDPSDPFRMNFKSLPLADALNCAGSSSELDSDLRLCWRLSANRRESFAKRRLVESLMDLRALRRAANQKTPYFFLWQLEASLKRRRRRCGAAVTEAAAWSLSSHFGDLMRVASDRIGQVVMRLDDDDDGGQHESKTGGKPMLVPCPLSSTDPVTETVVTMCVSWSRGVLSRRRQRGLLLITNGKYRMMRTVQRLLYGAEGYQALQLNQFMELYRQRHQHSSLHTTTADHTSREAATTNTSGTTAGLPSPRELREQLWHANPLVDECRDDEEKEEDEEDDDEEDDESGRRASRQPPRTRRRCEPATGPADGVDPEDDDPSAGMFSSQKALYDLLTSQTQTDLKQEEANKSEKGAGEEDEEVSTKLAAPSLTLQHWSSSMAVLRSAPNELPLEDDAGTSSGGAIATVVILDSNELSHSSLMEWLQQQQPSSAADSTSSNKVVDPTVVFSDVLLVMPSLSTMRMIESVSYRPTSSSSSTSASPRIRLIATDLSEREFHEEVAAEREAFASLAHSKATLTSRLLVDRASLQVAEGELRAGVLRRLGRSTNRVRRGADATGEPMSIIVDDRELRCALPHALFAAGIHLTPLTLITADYVLSREFAVERKSIPDFVQSLQSGRLNRQLAALSRAFPRPACLIEGSFSEPLQLHTPTSSSSGSPVRGTGGPQSLYHRIGKIVGRHPTVMLWWSRNALASAQLFAHLKATVAITNIDPSSISLTSTGLAMQEEEETAMGSRNTEVATQAAQVLSAFPGITPQNVNGVMQLCGSLLGLATISLAALTNVMTEEEASTLHTFLHRPLSEEVD